jgi:hypothetical protein
MFVALETHPQVHLTKAMQKSGVSLNAAARHPRG